MCTDETISERRVTGPIPGRILSAEGLEMAEAHFSLSQEQLKTYSPLAFAYIGDAVYELLIRTAVVTKGNTRPNRYHQESIQYVNAAAQTELMSRIKPLLNEEELKIFRRGCNAKPATMAKHQSRHDYRIATGLETLIGYLYLSGKTERILELVGHGLEEIGNRRSHRTVQ